jgi:hypothetical protein
VFDGIDNEEGVFIVDVRENHLEAPNLFQAEQANIGEPYGEIGGFALMTKWSHVTGHQGVTQRKGQNRLAACMPACEPEDAVILEFFTHRVKLA